MKLATRARAESIIADSVGVKDSLEKIGNISQDDLEEIANTYSTKPSTFLAAIIGGVVGGAGGIAIGGTLGAITLISGPAGMALGAAVAVLGWRGRDMWRHERAGDNFDVAIKRIDAAILALPKNAPQSDREELYTHRRKLIRSYARVADEAILSTNQPTSVTGLVNARGEGEKGAIEHQPDEQ